MGTHQSIPATSGDITAQQRLQIALAWINARRATKIAFDGNLVTDPMWDMLLDLYVNRSCSRLVTISDLCVASGVAATTSLRYVAILEAQGVIVRAPDVKDRRRIHMQLSDEGLERVELAIDLAKDGDRRLGLSRLEVLERPITTVSELHSYIESDYSTPSEEKISADISEILH